MVYAPVRLLPDADALVLAVLTAAGIPASMEEPPSIYTMLPWAVAYRFGGASLHPRLADVATVQVRAYGDGRQASADLAESCRTALYEAAQAQTVFDGAYINRFVEALAPADFPDSNLPTGVYRSDGAYSLRIRPVL